MCKKLLVFLDELFFTTDYKSYKSKSVSALFFKKFASVYKDVEISFSFPVYNGNIGNPGVEVDTKEYCVYPIRGWHSIISFYKGYFNFRKQIFRLAEKLSHVDAVFIRIPSPAGLLLGELMYKKGKKVIYNVVGDIKEAYKQYKIPLRIPAYFLSQYLYRQELKKDGIFLTVGSLLYNRFKLKNPIFFIDSLINEKDLKPVKINFSDSIQILYVGRLIEAKGIFFLIDAIVKLRDKYNVVLNIVGFGNDEERVKYFADKYNFIKFYGHITNRNQLNTIYASNDIFILPTINYPEGFPRVILEAWANGLFVLSSKVGGIEGIGRDKENILFFRAGDKNDFMNKMIDLLENKKLLQKLRDGIERIQRKITFEYFADVLYKILKRD